MHAFGGPDRYALPEVRSYTPQEASLASWRRAAATIGLEAAGDPATFERILATNPARLYSF